MCTYGEKKTGTITSKHLRSKSNSISYIYSQSSTQSTSQRVLCLPEKWKKHEKWRLESGEKKDLLSNFISHTKLILIFVVSCPPPTAIDVDDL